MAYCHKTTLVTFRAFYYREKSNEIENQLIVDWNAKTLFKGSELWDKIYSSWESIPQLDPKDFCYASEEERILLQKYTVKYLESKRISNWQGMAQAKTMAKHDRYGVKLQQVLCVECCWLTSTTNVPIMFSFPNQTIFPRTSCFVLFRLIKV